MALKRVYEDVSSTPKSIAPSQVRKTCSVRVREAFSHTNFQIKGSENLPYEKNVIFIYNHLKNHEFYTEDEGFQITLDSHFISSMILDKYYNDSGIRVVRHSLPDEDNHRNYYDRLRYIRVYAKKFLPKGLDLKDSDAWTQSKVTDLMKNNFMLSRPKFKGKYYLRIVMGNYNTKVSHIEELLKILDSY